MPDEADERYAFDRFPRGRLAFKVSRRKFLSALINEVEVYTAEGGARPSFRLADLGLLPDEELGQIVPGVAPGCTILVEDGYVAGQPAGDQQPVRLFPLDSPALAVFNSFNGMNTLAQAAGQLEAHTGWEPEKAFAYTRGVFLWLALARVCAPLGGIVG